MVQHHYVQSIQPYSIDPMVLSSGKPHLIWLIETFSIDQTSHSDFISGLIPCASLIHQQHQALQLTISQLEFDHNLPGQLPVAPMMRLLPHEIRMALLFCLLSRRPTKVLYNFNFSIVTTLVNMSIGFSIVWIFSNLNTLFSKSNLMKWYLLSKYLILTWKSEFFTRWMTL